MSNRIELLTTSYGPRGYRAKHHRQREGESDLQGPKTSPASSNHLETNLLANPNNLIRRWPREAGLAAKAKPLATKYTITYKKKGWLDTEEWSRRDLNKSRRITKEFVPSGQESPADLGFLILLSHLVSFSTNITSHRRHNHDNKQKRSE